MVAIGELFTVKENKDGVVLINKISILQHYNFPLTNMFAIRS